MEEMLKSATELGRQIARSGIFQRLRRAETAVQADDATRKLLSDFEVARRQVEELEAAQKPVEVETKHRVRDLADAVHANAALQELLRAQADYLAMMGRVNRAIQEQMNPEGGAAQSAQQES